MEHLSRPSAYTYSQSGFSCYETVKQPYDYECIECPSGTNAIISDGKSGKLGICKFCPAGD